MSDKTDVRTGRCLCGAVRFEATGEPHRVISCHCHSCRKHTGAPMSTMAVYAADRVSFTGETRKVFASRPGVGRAFCPDCGSSLTWETDHPAYGSICSIHVSAFDDPAVFVPSAHSFYPERLPWFDAADDLPRYEGFVAGNVLVRRGPA